MTKINEALRLMREEGLTAHAAALRAKLQPAAVYRKLAQAKRVPCPCCGSLVRPEQIDRTKLKD